MGDSLRTRPSDRDAERVPRRPAAPAPSGDHARSGDKAPYRIPLDAAAAFMGASPERMAETDQALTKIWVATGLLPPDVLAGSEDATDASGSAIASAQDAERAAEATTAAAEAAPAEQQATTELPITNNALPKLSTELKTEDGAAVDWAGDSERCSANNRGHLEDEFRCLMGIYRNALESMFTRQEDVLDALAKQAGDIDAPVKDELIATVATVAMAAVSGGLMAAIGGAIASRAVARGLSKKMADVVAGAAKGAIGAMAEVTANMVDQVGSGSADEAAPKSREDVTKAAPRFFGAQSKALKASLDRSRNESQIAEGPLRRAGQEGIDVRLETHAILVEHLPIAEQLQRQASIQAWSVYLAQATRGRTFTGQTDMRSRSASEMGVLDIQGQWSTTNEFSIDEASAEGLSDSFKRELSNTPIGELRVPMRFRFDITGDAPVSSGNSVSFAVNEAGVLHLVDDHLRARLWFHRISGQPLSEAQQAYLFRSRMPTKRDFGRLPTSATAAVAGARLMLRHMAGVRLPLE